MGTFIGKTVDELAEQALVKENYSGFILDGPVRIEADDRENFYADAVEAQVDGYSGVPVVVAVKFRNCTFAEESVFELDIGDAEELAKLLLFQVEVARKTLEKKLKREEQQTAE